MRRLLLYNKAEDAMRAVEREQRSLARKERRRAARAAAAAAAAAGGGGCGGDDDTGSAGASLCSSDDDEPPFQRLLSTERELPAAELFETERVARKTINKMRVLVSAGNPKFVNRPFARVETMLLENPLATPIYEKAAREVEQAQRARRMKEIQEAVAFPSDKKSKTTNKSKG